MDFDKIERIIEGILFAAGEPVALERIAQAVELDTSTTQTILRQLMQRLDMEKRGIQIVRLEEEYQMCTRPEYSSYIKSALDNRKEMVLSPAALEALAIIAYNQPITRAFVEQVRGVDSSGVISHLCEKNLIEEKGRLDAPGRPRTYGTTAEFLRTFALSSLEDLPVIDGQETVGDNLTFEETDFSFDSSQENVPDQEKQGAI